MREKLLKLFRQFISFGLVGGINTILSLVIYWGLVRLGTHYLIANAIAFIITVAISYALNNIFTFREKGENISWSAITLLKVYTSYFLTGILLNSLLLWLWIDCIGINQYISPVLNLFVTIPLNFLLNKLWAYKKDQYRSWW